MSEIGFGGITIVIVLVAIGIWFSIVTSSIIATALGATGLDWWIVFITMLGALGGCGGSLINLGKD